MRYHVLFEGSAASKNKLRVSDSPEITPPTQVEMFFKDALKNGLGETIQMQPGTVLFIDNHRAAHAVEYLANTKRLTYQLALPTLKPQLRPERAKTVSSFLRSRSV